MPDAPEVLIENITVEVEPEPDAHAPESGPPAGLDEAAPDPHEAHHAEVNGLIDQVCAELAELRELVVGHGSSYHMTEEDGRRWTEMSELSELRAQVTTLREELATLREAIPASPSSSTPPPTLTPESPTASETAPEGSSPASSEPAAVATPPLPSAASLEVAVQEAPPVETEKRSRKKGSEKRFRRSLGRTAPR